ncbi:hypothetical protein V6Z11_D05G382700 [Gossypium hirsutum]
MELIDLLMRMQVFLAVRPYGTMKVRGLEPNIVVLALSLAVFVVKKDALDLLFGIEEIIHSFLNSWYE